MTHNAYIPNQENLAHQDNRECKAVMLPFFQQGLPWKKNQFLIQFHENFDQKTYTSPDARMLAPLGMVGAIRRGALAGGGPAP